jgi:hypothetical protein
LFQTPQSVHAIHPSDLLFVRSKERKNNINSTLIDDDVEELSRLDANLVGVCSTASKRLLDRFAGFEANSKDLLLCQISECGLRRLGRLRRDECWSNAKTDYRCDCPLWPRERKDGPDEQCHAQFLLKSELLLHRKSDCQDVDVSL